MLQRNGLKRDAYRSLLAGTFALLCACGGGGTSGPLAPAPTVAPVPSSGTQSVVLGSVPVRAVLPTITGISGSLTFPAVRTPVTISVSASAKAPAPGTLVPAASRRQKLSNPANGILTIYEYITIESPLTITLPSLPAMTLTFPASTPVAGQNIFYGISDPSDRGGLVSFDTHGPATVQGQTVSFAAIATPVTFAANRPYTFVVFSSALTASAAKIFISSNNGIVTYDANGNGTSPEINDASNSPFGLAIASGKLYVTNFGTNSVTTYTTDGTLTTPTLTAGLLEPDAVTIDAKGTIYVASFGDFNGGSVTTYSPSGAQTTPTITAGLNGPSGVAVNAAGSIYVANNIGANVTVYSASGSQTGSIVVGVNQPTDVKVDAAGKIYVANFGNNSITTYEPNGSQTSPTITAGIDQPQALALDDAGNIYVLNDGNGTLTTYNPDGTPTTPTIEGLNLPTGLAVQTLH